MYKPAFQMPCKSMTEEWDLKRNHKKEVCCEKFQSLLIFATVKKAVIIFALFLLAKPLIPLAKYIVFYDYYVNVLCENKQEPESTCKGTCHLKQELADNANEHLPQNTSKWADIEIIFCNSLIDYSLICYVNADKHPFYFKTSFTDSYSTDFLKPPIA